MRRLAWGVLAALALGASSAMGWQGEYWPDWVPVEKKGTVFYWDPDARKYNEIPVEVDSDGNVVWDNPGGLDEQTLAAIEALTVALKAEASVEQLQHRVDATAKEFNDKLTELKDEVGKNAKTLAAHLNRVGDEDSLTNLLDDVAFYGLYSCLNSYPELTELVGEDVPDGFFCFGLYLDSEHDKGLIADAVTYGHIQLANVAKDGMFTSLTYASADDFPIQSFITQEGNTFKVYNRTLNPETLRIEYTAGNSVTINGDCSETCSCRSEHSGDSGGTYTCDCEIKTTDDLPPEEDPIFTEWRDGTFDNWKTWVDNQINTMAQKVVSLEQWMGKVPINPRYPGPGSTPGLDE